MTDKEKACFASSMIKIMTVYNEVSNIYFSSLVPNCRPNPHLIFISPYDPIPIPINSNMLIHTHLHTQRNMQAKFVDKIILIWRNKYLIVLEKITLAFFLVLLLFSIFMKSALQLGNANGNGTMSVLKIGER